MSHHDASEKTKEDLTISPLFNYPVHCFVVKQFAVRRLGRCSDCKATRASLLIRIAIYLAVSSKCLKKNLVRHRHNSILNTRSKLDDLNHAASVIELIELRSINENCLWVIRNANFASNPDYEI